jgi:hypothetical protein
MFFVANTTDNREGPVGGVFSREGGKLAREEFKKTGIRDGPAGLS